MGPEASAGGLETLVKFIAEVPANSDVASIAVTHRHVAVHYANMRRKLKLATYPDLIRLAVRMEEARNLPR